jgi:hypothetical protein
MSAATQRIPVLVTPEEKEQISNLAKDAGLSMGEYFRRAVTAFRPSEDEALLEGMIEQMKKTAALAEAAIDETLAFVAASNERIAQMELSAGQRRAA